MLCYSGNLGNKRFVVAIGKELCVVNTCCVAFKWIFVWYQQLKPYVPYDTKAITQEKFTAQDLFNTCYAKDISEKFKEGEYVVENDELVKKPSSSWSLNMDGFHMSPVVARGINVRCNWIRQASR